MKTSPEDDPERSPSGVSVCAWIGGFVLYPHKNCNVVALFFTFSKYESRRLEIQTMCS